MKEQAWQVVEEKLWLDWGPEQASTWLNQMWSIQGGQESIYQYIYADKSVGGSLYMHLRRKKNGKNARESTI